ncbi:MAG: hypothetical protein AB7L84_10550 [Acidimicrobiia bacterium]
MTAPLSGAVYDRSYRPYEGDRGGRRASVLALYRSTIRRALGIRRSWRQKVLPWTLLAIATVPAVVNVGVGYLTRDTPAEDFEFITYREYVGVSSALLMFVAVTAPDVLCPDRRNRVLPLIFSRPLTGTDYALAKLAAITTLVFGFAFLPQVVLFVGQMLVSDGALDYLVDNAEVIWQVAASAAVLSVFYAAGGLALASLTTRRVVGGVAFLAALLISSSVAGILTSAEPGRPSAWLVLNLAGLPLILRDLVFLGHVDRFSELSGVEGGGALAVAVYLVVLATSVGILVWRYRWVEA